MNTSLDLNSFKKSSLLFFISMVSHVVTILIITGWLVHHHTWQEQGTARVVVIGISISLVLLIYAILCFKAFKNPNVQNVSIIYGIQSILFAIFSVLLWVAIFTPAY